MNSAFRRAIRERFGLKVLLAVAAGIIVSLAVFTAVMAVREGDRLKKGLKDRGETFASLLAQGSVIGIFSENEELLRQAAAGVLAAHDVVAVSMYSGDLRPLYRGAGGSTLRNASVITAPETVGPSTDETDESIEIVLPVTSALPVERDETLYFGPSGGKAAARVLGCVQVVLSKESYRREVNALIVRNALLMGTFVLMSLFIVALSVRRVLRPLARLTENVKAFEKGIAVDPAPVETQDEIGRLASALNDMVSARRSAEASLRESEERYRRLVELSPDAIYVQQEGSIVFINQTGAHLMGAAGPASVIGNSTDDLLDEESRKPVAERMRQVENEGVLLTPFPVLYRRPDGITVEAEMTAAPFLFRGKQAALVIARDVTERRGLEEKVRAYEKELYTVAAEMSAMEARIEERERYQIAADLHDYVGQNLVLAQFKLGALARSVTTPVDARRIDELRDVIARTIQYTRTLTVELSPPDLAEIGLSAAVEALAEGFARAYGIEIEVADRAGRTELGQEARYLLYRNVRELLVNVVKHADATTAQVSLYRSGERFAITVADNGTGFDLADAVGEKSGFGFFAIRERMERMNGTCEISSTSDSGTMVTLTIPA